MAVGEDARRGTSRTPEAQGLTPEPISLTAKARSLTPEAQRQRLQEVFNFIQEQGAIIRKENAVNEMLARDCIAREASTIAHETGRARQLQWEAATSPVEMDIEAVHPSGQELLTHEEQ